MISLYTGTPGSGKSLDVAQRISNIIKYQDKFVVTNIPINVELFKKRVRHKYFYLSNNELTPDKLMSISKLYFENHKIAESRIVVIIDEAQLLFNARTWNAKGRAEWNNFFTLHRHLGIDFILVCQFESMLDKQIRYLVEYQYIHRNLLNFGWRGFLIFFLSFGRRFMVIKYWYPCREKISSELIYCKKRLFKLYDTYMLFE